MANVPVKGLAEMRAMFQQLPANLQQTVALGALRAGANVVAEEARRLAPVGPPSNRGRKFYGQYAGGLRNDIRVTNGALNNGIAQVSIYVGGGKRRGAIFYAHMVEYGTAAHWIKVRMESRPERNTRHGPRKYSMRTINRMAKSGSLKIGQHFVGESVSHPGARKQSFMRASMDNKGAEASQAIADYIRANLGKIRSKAGLPMEAAA